MYLLGYNSDRNGYRLYDPSSKKILASKNIVFNENRTQNWDAIEAEQRMVELGSQNNFDVKLGSKSSDEVSEANFDNTLVRGTRYIDEIHQSADIALLEPMNFEEAETIES